MKYLVIAIVGCLAVAIFLPTAYWSVLFFARVLLYGGIGFALGYLYGRATK